MLPQLTTLSSHRHSHLLRGFTRIMTTTHRRLHMLIDMTYLFPINLNRTLSTDETQAIKSRNFIAVQLYQYTVHALISKKFNQERKPERFKEKQIIKQESRAIVESILSTCLSRLRPEASFEERFPDNRGSYTLILPDTLNSRGCISDACYFAECEFSEYTDHPEKWVDHLIKFEPISFSKKEMTSLFMHTFLFGQGEDPLYRLPSVQKVKNAIYALSLNENKCAQKYPQLAKLAEDPEQPYKEIIAK